jgi:tetratricopeptide (TPR) repeat protein
MNILAGQKLLTQKEFGKALDLFLNLKKNNVGGNEILFFLGLTYFELNHYNKSIYYYNKFLKKKPNSKLALYNMAFVKQSIGRIEDAKNIYLKLLEIDKNKIRPYYGLFTLNQNFIDNEKFEVILNMKNNFNHSPFEDGMINYLLSKKEKKNKNYLKEIEYLNNSHRLVFDSKKIYNKSSQFYYNEIISKFYDKINFSNNDEKKFKNDEIIPIFIIGLPRSGSTLVEAILSSSSKNIHSFGESHIINMSILDQIGSKIYTKNFDKDKFNFEINLKVLSDSISRRYQQYNLSKNINDKIIIDKSLENFFNIDIIKAVFPKAKFLHTFRNTFDSIISIYQSMLAELSWTHSIEDIVIYIDNYIKIVNYFKKKYPTEIMDIELEVLTNDSEKFSKEIYKFCELSWNSDVLKFYKRENLHSKTLSFGQIRNKISKYDKTKYQPYYNLIKNYQKKFKWLNLN